MLSSFHFPSPTQSCYHHFTLLPSHNHAIIISLPFPHTIMLSSFHFTSLTQSYYHFTSLPSHNHAIIISLYFHNTIILSSYHFPSLTQSGYHHFTSLPSHIHAIIISLPFPHTIRPSSFHFPSLTQSCCHVTSLSSHNHAITDLPTPKYFCQYSKQPVFIFSDFWLDFYCVRMQHQSACGCNTNQSKQKSIKGQFFCQSSC